MMTADCIKQATRGTQADGYAIVCGSLRSFCEALTEDRQTQMLGPTRAPLLDRGLSETSRTQFRIE
jgi:hypothetical protein